MDWGEWARAPLQALTDLSAGQTEILNRLTQMEANLMANEQESRDQLSGAITGALAAYDQAVADRDRYKAALEEADATTAQAVADALAAESADDVAFNESKVEELRRLQPTVDEPPSA